MSRIVDGIKDYVSTSWEELKKRPVAGILSFIGPGLLFKLGFPWLAAAYELAGALGFDWVGFWDGLKNSVIEVFTNAIHGERPTQEQLHQKITEQTDENLAQHTTDKVDVDKLAEIQRKSGITALPASTGAKNISYLVKQAGIFSSAAKSRGILSSIFRKLIPFVITTAAVSLGFAVAGGAARGVAGIKTDKKDPASGEDQETDSSVRSPIYSLKMSPQVDQDLFEFNKNDATTVWLESGDINAVPSYLSSWILSAYPQLKDDLPKITNSPAFIQVENMFRNRNKMAEGLNIYSVPKPFQRKIDIVSYVLNSWLKTKGNS